MHSTNLPEEKNLLDLPPHLLHKILYLLPYQTLQTLRSVGLPFKTFFDRSILPRSKIRLPYAELQKAGNFQLAVKLLKRRTGPRHKFTILIPHPKSGPLVLILTANILQALYKNVKNTPPTTTPAPQKVLYEPDLSFEAKSGDFDHFKIHVASLHLDLNFPPDKTCHMIGYKMWSTICSSDPRMYRITVNRVDLETRSVPRDKSSPELKDALISCRINMTCPQVTAGLAVIQEGEVDEAQTRRATIAPQQQETRMKIITDKICKFAILIVGGLFAFVVIFFALKIVIRDILVFVNKTE